MAARKKLLRRQSLRTEAPVSAVEVTKAEAVMATPAPAPRPANPLPRSVWRGADGTVKRDLAPAELRRVVETGEGLLWVDVETTSRTQHALLEHVFHFHPLAIEDTLNPVSRVKVEEYPGYLFLVIRAVSFCEDTADPYDLETANVCHFLGRNYLVTVRTERAPAVEMLADRLAMHPEFLERGPSWLLYVTADAAVDSFFPILDRVDEFIDGLEERVFTAFDDAALHEIFSVKRLVLTLRRHLVPQREIFNVLTNRPTPLLAPESQLYFRDVYDHVLRINDALDTYRELLSSTMDAYLTQVSNRLGTATKRLSVIATISLPFVVVSGMWGMNFANMPLAGRAHGFLTLVGIQLALGVALLAYLRWRRVL